MNLGDKIWFEDGALNAWLMPVVPRWKRWPVIRHVRATYHWRRAVRFRSFTAAMGLGIGGVPQFDRWVVYGIARGFERVVGE